MRSALNGRFAKWTAIALITVVVASSGSAARADLIDGNLADWGVTPFSNWTPSVEAAWVVGNYPTGNFPNGGEVFDIEAMYLRMDASHLRVGIVTSFPEAGVADPYNTAIWIVAGDLLIDVQHQTGPAWDYAVILNGADKGDLYHDPSLVLPNANVGIPANGPSNVDVAHSGLPISRVQVAWHNYGDLEGYGSDTWGIELSIPLGQLGVGYGELVTVHHTMGCGNDALSLSGAMTAVPEPTTLSILAIGATVPVLRAWRRRHAAK